MSSTSRHYRIISFISVALLEVTCCGALREMKVIRPLVVFLVLLVIASILVGWIMDTTGFVMTYSSTLCLLVCLATAGHFLEEYTTKVWKKEVKIRMQTNKTPQLNSMMETSL